jgi:apolipoprotein N-acyltransferase
MPKVNLTRNALFAALSGLLWTLAFPRFDWQILAWVAWVPLFCAMRDATPARAAQYGFLAGMVFYLASLSWITNTLTNFGGLPRPVSWLVLALLAAYLSCFCALFCWLLQRLTGDRPLRFLLFAPFLWTALEYLRSTHEEYGFAWLCLGYSQYRILPAIQIAEFTGVYGISTLLMFINATVHHLIDARLARKTDSARHPPGMAGGVAVGASAVLALCFGYGYYALAQIAPVGAPVLKVALIQGNISQNMKWDPEFKAQVMDTYRNLTLKAAKEKPDLIVWPEAATPFFFDQEFVETLALKNLVREAGAPLLFGSPHRERRDSRSVFYNSAFLLSPDGETQGRYDKIHLVPFGEFVPFQKALWFVRKLVSMVGDFGRGTESTVFTVQGRRFGVSICYEIIFPDLVRRPVALGAEFLVNITNDAWFGDSAASYQHISMGALRAVENRVPIVRAANTGITGVIDANGALRHTTQLFVEDAVTVTITPARHSPTFYSRYGDLFSFACLGLALILGWKTRSLLA